MQIKKDSDVQKFLVGTNIGQCIVTSFLAHQNVQALFSYSLDLENIEYIYSLMSVDPKLEINTAFWDEAAVRDKVVDSVLLLGELANSAEISKDIQTTFSGVAGNVILLTPGMKNCNRRVFYDV